MNTWHEAKRLLNLKNHGVDFADLDEFFDGDLLTREDARGTYEEQRWQSIGVAYSAVLFVVWTVRQVDDADTYDDIPHLISARKAESHEYKAWQSRYKKR